MKKIYLLTIIFHFFLVFSPISLFAQSLHDGYLETDYTLEKYLNLTGEMLRVELFGKTGSFNIFCKNQEGQEVPLFSSANMCTSTGFLLKIDGRMHRINAESRIIRELRKYDNGAQLVFTVDNNVRFVIDFSLIKSASDKPEDIVRIRTYAINLGLESHSVDIKGIFDTVAGEASSVHFSTEKNTKIRNETRFVLEEIQRERTAVCTNDSTSFQFVFSGNQIQPIDSIVFANVDEIYKMEWDSGIRKGRGFTNIRSYEDSAIMVDWPSFMLSPDQKIENTFFIAAATNDESPRGIFYVDNYERIKAENSEEAEKTEETEEKAAPPAKENSDKRTDVDFVVMPIKDYQLDPEYIQALIDKIDILQSSKNVDKKEIQKLNAELDAILEKLRQR